MKRKDDARPNSPGSVRFNVRLYRNPDEGVFRGKVCRSDEPNPAKSIPFTDFVDLERKMRAVMGEE